MVSNCEVILDLANIRYLTQLWHLRFTLCLPSWCQQHVSICRLVWQMTFYLDDLSLMVNKQDQRSMKNLVLKIVSTIECFSTFLPIKKLFQLCAKLWTASVWRPALPLVALVNLVNKLFGTRPRPTTMYVTLSYVCGYCVTIYYTGALHTIHIVYSQEGSMWYQTTSATSQQW